MAESLANPLTANELTYDLGNIDMNDLWEKNANKGQSTYAFWDEESGHFYLATVEPHSEMDLLLSGRTIEDITTVDYSEPVYFVGAGSHELGEVSRQWDVQDSGAVNMSEGWMTESELREQWNASEGMGYFKKANPNMDFDAYFNMVKDGTSRYQAAGGLMAGEQESFLAQLAADHGVQTTWQNSDGDVFNFTGSGYAKTFKVDDHAGPGDYMKMAMLAAVGWAAGPAITSALASSLGAAGAKAASSAIINLAKSYVTNGELSIEDALLGAALSYGGSELSDALQGSGVIGDIGSKITDFGNDIASNGGDILTAAMTAGGMSLVSQMVKDGEIDWKDAAIAAAMAGGTVALKDFLSGIGKSGAEDDVLEEIKVTAQRKGTQVGDGLWMLDDGTVISDTGNVLGDMSNLDLDGDGALNANDLQGIDPRNDYVSTTPFGPDEYYDADGDGKYTAGVDRLLAAPDSTTNPTAFTKEWANERYGSLSEDQTIAAMQRDGFTDEQIAAYVEGRYDDIGVINPNLVTHAGGWVENMEQPYTLEYRDGRHYVIMDGKLKAISEDAYADLYADLQSGGDWQATMDKYGVTDGGNIFGGYDAYGRPIYNQSATADDWITLDGTQPPVTAPIDDFVDTPPETPETDNTSKESNGGNQDGLTGKNESGAPADPGGSAPGGGGNDAGATDSGAGGNNIPDFSDLFPGFQLPGDDKTTGDTSTTTGDTPVNSGGGTEQNGDTDGGGRPTSPGGNQGGNTGSDSSTTTGSGGGNVGGTTGSDGTGSGGSGSGSDDVDGDKDGTTAGGGSGGTGNSGDGQGNSGDGSGTGDKGTGGGASDSGAGDGYGDGWGDGWGDGSGDGSGRGNGNGLGNGMLAGAGGDGRPTWGELFASPQFRKHTPYQSKVTRRLFEDLMKDNLV